MSSTLFLFPWSGGPHARQQQGRMGKAVPRPGLQPIRLTTRSVSSTTGLAANPILATSSVPCPLHTHAKRMQHRYQQACHCRLRRPGSAAGGLCRLPAEGMHESHSGALQSAPSLHAASRRLQTRTQLRRMAWLLPFQGPKLRSLRQLM